MKRVIALGFFDGVHMGHGALLRLAAERARVAGATPAAVTFDTRPEAVVTGQAARLVNSLEDRIGLMERLYGVAEVLTLPFDDALRHMDWRAFVTDLLAGHFGAVHLVAGYDFRFGYGGAGDPVRLRALCAELGIGCDIVPAVELDGGAVSSTRVRQLLLAGEMERAVRLLGHPHVLTGVVTHGRGIGTAQLGVPTANLPLPPGVLCPAHGVYAARVVLQQAKYPAVVNVGTRPTVAPCGAVTIEAHLIDFSGDLYGQKLRIEFRRRLRPEMRFESPEALKEQLARDIAESRS